MTLSKDEQISRLDCLLEDALATIERQSIRISELEQEVARLSVKKSSNNSSLPPSTDLARKNKSLCASSGRPVGGQIGHKGHNLPLRENADIVIKLSPSYCSGCGGDLGSAPGVMTGRRQVVDIPPVKPVYTEYQQYVKQCPCCGKQQSMPYPPDVTNHIQYGVNVQTMAVYNWLYQYLPFGRLRQWFSDIFQLSIGKGTLENIIRKASSLARPTYEQIHQRLLTAPCVGADETGMKVNGKKQWIWVWQTKEMTWLYCSENRGSATITDLFPEGFMQSVLVSDRWRAQLGTAAAGHQLCLAHLLRDLNFIMEVEKECNTATKLKAVLQLGIEHKKQYPESQKNSDACLTIEKEMDNLLNAEIDKVMFPLTAKMQKSLLLYRNHVFEFLYNKEIPYENNASERSIRMVKVKQKISGCFKSLHQNFCVLKSVVDTEMKNQQNAFNILKKLLLIPVG